MQRHAQLAKDRWYVNKKAKAKAAPAPPGENIKEPPSGLPETVVHPETILRCRQPSSLGTADIELSAQPLGPEEQRSSQLIQRRCQPSPFRGNASCQPIQKRCQPSPSRSDASLPWPTPKRHHQPIQKR
eukprot:4418817-Pyramimonas_sp.AAC.1